MSNPVKIANELYEEGKKIVNVQPFDDFLLYSLERRHLDAPSYSNLLLAHSPDEMALDVHFQNNVRFFKLEEISFDTDEALHLPGVESVLSSMRGQGHSLLFLVQGTEDSTQVFMGVSRFGLPSKDGSEVAHIAENYQKFWQAHFPGSKISAPLTADTAEKDSQELTTKKLSDQIGECKEIGVLTGIPSLKRDEESQMFVQGLERLIRAMRGKTYTWLSIADPIPHADVRAAIATCRNLESEIHRLVKTNFSKTKSVGKTIMLGAFGMQGSGDTGGGAHTDSISDSVTKTVSKTITDSEGQNLLEKYQRVSSGISGGAAVIGGIIGSFLLPGIGTAVGAGIGKLVGGMVGGIVNDVGAAATGKSGHSITHSVGMTKGVSKTHTEGHSDTKSWAHTTQSALGGFGSFGLTWTKATQIGEELLNRKAEYAEEVLRAYEKRLQEGTALGMWNLGHYFCAKDPDTYRQGIGAVNSLFAGMDSTFEPPRAIKMPTEFGLTLCRFQNVYLRFCENISRENADFRDHPLGILFNGPATPVNTRELAIATPVALQDVEGVSVSRRPAFGINLNSAFGPKEKTLTLGKILDKGNATNQSYRMLQANLTKHLAVFGLTGSGKTNTVHYLLRQLWKNERIPFLVIEPAKAEYRALAAMDEFKDDLLVISAGIDRTAACPLRLNPFDFEPGSDTDANRVHVLTHIDRLKATFNASFPMYASMPYILEEAILEVYRERGWDLGRSENRFVDVYREDFCDYLPTLRDLYWKISETVRRKGYFQEQQMNIEAALKARLSSLLVGAKGTMLDTPRSLPAKDLFERPVVIELENLGDDDEKAFLMGLLVSRLYEWRKATFANDAARPLRHLLVIEEAHRLLANIPDTSANMEAGNPRGKAVSAFVDMLSEIRAYGEGVVVVDQLPSRVSPNIVKGTGAKIVHRLLAKDDRENVGGTMGLTDEQIADLSLLSIHKCPDDPDNDKKNGADCVVSQDGDLKSFQVRVPKCKAHESRTGGELSDFTAKYRTDNTKLFSAPASGIDAEDGVFKDSFYKTMLAIGIGQAPSTLADVRPTRPVGAWTDRADWLAVYWKQICAEIWNSHGGDWRALLALRTAGAVLLDGTDGTADSYRAAFADYFRASKLAAESPTGKLAGIAFEPFLVGGKKGVLEIVNRNFSPVKDATDRYAKLADAIRRALPILEPRGRSLALAVRTALAEEIVTRINPALVVETLSAFKKGEV